MKKELQIFFTALMFFTRIPVPKSVGYSNENLNKSVRYLPLVGGIVGGVGVLAFLLFSSFLPSYVALLISMASTVFVTGAFHEDGFADFCDGFGGGYTKEKIMLIMKDSRIGTYGGVGLMLLLSIKFASLHATDLRWMGVAIFSGHVFSRFSPALFMYTSSYVRDDSTSKAKPVGEKVSTISLVIAFLLAFSVLFFFSWVSAMVTVGVSLVIFLFFTKYVIHKIGGYTGDVLGALQQLTELGFYLSLAALYPSQFIV